MKKIIWSFLFVSALFVSCGDDDDDSSKPANNNNEVEKDEVVTKENCLDVLKKNYGIDIQLPLSSYIAMYSDVSYEWGATFMCESGNNDGQEMAKKLFSNTQNISKDGLFGRDKSAAQDFVKGDEYKTLDETITVQYDDYVEYEWYFKSENGSNVHVYVENDMVKGIYKIGIN